MTHIDQAQIKDKPEPVKIGFDSLIGDIIGLNIDGLKSVGTLFKRPKDYFNAAKDANWLRRYRPSIRLWFAIFALTTALKFIWASEASPIFNLLNEQFPLLIDAANSNIEDKSQHIILSADKIKQAVRYCLSLYMFLIPVFIFSLILILATFYRAWGEKLSYVVRLRYLFAIMITGNFLGFIFSTFMNLIPSNIFQSVNYIGLGCMYLLYGLTAYRGAFAHMDGSARLGRSLAVTGTLIAVTLIATTLALLTALMVTMRTHFV